MFPPFTTAISGFLLFKTGLLFSETGLLLSANHAIYSKEGAV